MANNLVILESPTKAPTIKGFLGSGYRVVASKGHVRDLPKSTLGVDIENGFAAHYINIRGKGELIKEIKKEVQNADKVFLATDPDREGEAISWHLAAALDIPPEKAYRVTFNEITKTAVKTGIKNPRKIDMNLVNAQQARRIYDRIVGYKLSPFLWKNVKNGLSAGRVQSVATRIIVDREEEIRAFEPEEYWTIDATLYTEDGKSFSVKFYGDENGKIKLANESEAQKVLRAVAGKPFTVKSIKHAIKHKFPAPPFTTSTLQQEASKKLGFQSARTMKVAQELYEGVNIGAERGGSQGLITYMRTDSQRVSTDAQPAAKALITEKYGEKYCPATFRNYKSRSGAQDAHEAIRPAKPEYEPQLIKSHLTPDQFKLYKLIWDRFIASQMESATLATVTADFDSAGYIFRTGGYTVTFPGYMAVYEETDDETVRKADEAKEEKDIKMPALTEGQLLGCEEVIPAKHFTEAPPRYTEASLIKFLEEKGIGRPSTYTPIITTIISREYVARDGKMLVPTKLGEITTKLMKESFADIVDYTFTANMEDRLDGIENGNDTLEGVLGSFWADFEPKLKAADEKTEKAEPMPVVETDLICDKCGATMVVKSGRYGKFAACPNYPKCKNTKPLEEKKPKAEAAKPEKPEPVKTDIKCELCGADMVIRSGKFGSFYACSNFPKCKNTKQIAKEIDVKCPKCGAKILRKHGRNKSTFYSCERYPECDFSSWDMPTDKTCPDCGKMLFVKKGKNMLVCADRKCGYKCEHEEAKDQD
ncbi:MAG: type I DNA topoisomerase [Clostridia bacterium]|nr:type I DNA topoisomerase [Clostridia bacterium]